jgi:hypothetical protein
MNYKTAEQIDDMAVELDQCKENKLPLGIQEKLEDAWDKRKADNFQEKEDGHSNPRL